MAPTVRLTDDRPPDERRRLPGPLVILAIAAIVGAFAAAIYFAVREDPDLPVMTRENSPR